MFAALIARQAVLQPEGPALFGPQGGISYGQLNNSINRIGAALRRELPGSRCIVAVDMFDAVSNWVVTLALARLGHVSLAAPPQPEVLAAVAPDYVVTHKEAETGLPTIRISPEWWKAAIAAPPHAIAEQARWSDPARIVLSSGTTGRPKQIMLTHQLIKTRLGSGSLSQNGGVGLGRTTRMLVTMGSATIGGFASPLQAWAAGGAVIARYFDVTKNPEELRRNAITSIIMSTGQLRLVLDALPADFEPIPALTIIVGGSLLTRSVAVEAQRRLTPNIITAYGSTEAGGVSGASVDVVDTEANEVGLVFPWVEVEAIGPDGSILPAGTVGEIRIRGDDLVTGYLGDQQASERAFRDGWFHPGDVGSLSSSGVLRIVGRVDDLINVGGAKMAPEGIEDRLRAVPGIADAALFSTLGGSGVQQMHVAIVQGPAFDEAALAAAVKEHINVGPIRVHFMSRIPRNEMSKVNRQELRLRFQRNPTTAG